MLDPARQIAELLHRDRRYLFDAYAFVFEALRYAQEDLGLGTENYSQRGEVTERDDRSRNPQRHVTGQELCEAIRQYALRQYGYMAKTVLNSWGIHSTSDFGEIVFNLIGIGQMRKTPADSREDFDDVYDFDTALRQEFKITLPE